MSGERVWLPRKLEGYPAKMFKYVKRRLGYTTNYLVLIHLIEGEYEKQLNR